MHEYRVQIINDVCYLDAEDRNQAVADGVTLYLRKHPMSKYSKSALKMMGHAKKVVRYDDELSFKGFKD